MNLHRIQDPNLFLFEPLQELMLEALATSPMVSDANQAVLELADLVRDPRVGLFVTLDEGENLHGLLLCQLSRSALSPGCLVQHFYNRGSNAESRNLLIQGLIAFTQSAGLSKIWGLDINQSDPAFARLFKSVGKPTPRGTMFEFEVET